MPQLSRHDLGLGCRIIALIPNARTPLKVVYSNHPVSIVLLRTTINIVFKRTAKKGVALYMTPITSKKEESFGIDRVANGIRAACP
jgi:hypothetical protein